jgi:hypothetical protein
VQIKRLDRSVKPFVRKSNEFYCTFGAANSTKTLSLLKGSAAFGAESGFYSFFIYRGGVDCRGGSFLDNGSRLNGRGRNFFDNGSRLNDRSGSFLDNGSRLDNRGGSFLDNGSRLNDRGGSLLDNGSRLDDRGRSFLDNGSGLLRFSVDGIFFAMAQRCLALFSSAVNKTIGEPKTESKLFISILNGGVTLRADLTVG